MLNGCKCKGLLDLVIKTPREEILFYTEYETLRVLLARVGG